MSIPPIDTNRLRACKMQAARCVDRKSPKLRVPHRSLRATWNPSGRRTYRTSALFPKFHYFFYAGCQPSADTLSRDLHCHTLIATTPDPQSVSIRREEERALDQLLSTLPEEIERS